MPADLFSAIEDPHDITRVLREQVSARPRRRVLLLTANPTDQERVRRDAEYRDLQQAIDRTKDPKVEIQVVLHAAVRARDLLTTTLQDFDIIHFSGYAGKQGLAIENDLGETHLLAPDIFAAYLSRAKDRLYCVVLNACFTDAFASKVLPVAKFVIGCDDTIDDDAARLFACSFYEALAAGRHLRDAFELAQVVLRNDGLDDEADKYVIRP